MQDQSAQTSNMEFRMQYRLLMIKMVMDLMTLFLQSVVAMSMYMFLMEKQDRFSGNLAMIIIGTLVILKLLMSREILMVMAELMFLQSLMETNREQVIKKHFYLMAETEQ